LWYTTAGEISKRMVKPGRYRHYKGKVYDVIGCAKHSETEEEFVVYRALYGKRGLWIRPKAMFLDTVTVDGKPVPRFKRLQKRPS
jgi:hypothetical protein